MCKEIDIGKREIANLRNEIEEVREKIGRSRMGWQMTPGVDSDDNEKK